MVQYCSSFQVHRVYQKPCACDVVLYIDAIRVLICEGVIDGPLISFRHGHTPFLPDTIESFCHTEDLDLVSFFIRKLQLPV